MVIWKRRRRRAQEEPEEPEFEEKEFEDVFEEFDKVQEMMSEFMRQAFSKPISFKIEQLEPGKPMVYGFSLKITPEGKPIFREFGNVEPGKKPTIRPEREPLVDVIERTKKITVLAELPGVEKKEINVSVGEDNKTLIIDVPNKFYKELELPAKVKPKLAKAHYRNGILEVVLTKEKESKPKKMIKVE